jgi:hypothetical protein
MRPILLLAAMLAWSAPSHADELSRPNLQFDRIEQYSANGKDWVRYRFQISNRADYDSALFAASPNLPPCGKNANAARTWVDFFTPGAGSDPARRLYGFCALGAPEQLGQLWFAVEAGQEPPRWVFVELTDRLSNQTVRSNLAIVP